MSGRIQWNTQDSKQIAINTDRATNTSFRSDAHARKVLGIIQDEIDKGIFQRDEWKRNPTIGKLLTTDKYMMIWLQNREKMCEDGIIVPRTLKDDRTCIQKHIAPVFKNMPFSQITERKIQHFYDTVPLSKAGKYNVVSTLRTVFHDAKADGVIKTVPIFPKMGKKKSNEPKQFMLPEVQQKVIAEIPKEHRPIFHAMRQYGLRPSEARAVYQSSISNGKIIIERSFSENLLRNTTKTGELRSYLLTPFIQNMLNHLPKSSSPFLFDRGDGKAYTSKNLNKIWRQALLDAGLPHFKMYNAFRHSLARNLLQQGYGFDVVAEVLGHASVEMTRAHYADMPDTVILDALTDLSQSQQWDGR